MLRTLSEELKSTAGVGRGSFKLTTGIVPPGSARMKLTFQWRYDDAANNTAADRDWVLTWRPADSNAEPTDYEKFLRQPPKETGNHRKVYEINLKPGQTDAFYQKKSLWIWLPSPAGFENDRFHPDTVRARTFQLAVEVFRDPKFDAGA